MNRKTMVALLLAGLVTAGGCAAPAQQTPPERRQALLAEGVSVAVLREALADGDVIVRRTATRRLQQLGATEALQVALGDPDLLVRRTALAALIAAGGDTGLQAVERALTDSSSLIRLLAVQHLAASRPYSELQTQLLVQACSDVDDKVREIATRATWPFFRDAPSVRDGGTDLDITAGQTIRLPKDDWQFRLDPKREGHRQGWFVPTMDDADWARIAIEQVWQQAGYDYTGVAWYRRTFELPEEPEHFAIDIAFGGVDESTWFWINGVYAGDHDIGPGGWNVPFRRDVTALLHWGATNQITVRAMNTAHGGGIWKPIDIEVLQR